MCRVRTQGGGGVLGTGGQINKVRSLGQGYNQPGTFLDSPHILNYPCLGLWMVKAHEWRTLGNFFKNALHIT
jgi:hypothetical protein